MPHFPHTFAKTLRALFLIGTLTFCCSVSALTDAGNRYIQYADSADYYIKREKFPDAERCLLTALRAEPDNGSNYLLLSNLSIVRNRQGNTRGALEALDAGVAMAPRSTVLRINRAQTLMKLNMTDEALEDFQAALDVDSLLETPLSISAMLLLDKGDTVRAKPLIDRLIRSFPAKASGYIAKASLFIKKGNVRDALPLFQEAIKRDDNEEYYQMAIMSCLQAEMLPEADELLLKALDKYPRHGNLYLLRAISHRRKYQNDLADIDLRMAEEYGADSDLLRLYRSMK